MLRRTLAIALSAVVITSIPSASIAAELGEMVNYAMTFPVQGGASYTDTFGAPRSHGTHEGQDLFAPKGTPVVAVASGTIELVNFSSDPGDLLPDRCCSIVIDHDDGWESWYLHLDNDSPGTDDGAAWGIADGLVPGDHVSAGQLIGWVGDSGNAEDTPPHIHFELHNTGDTIVNPYLALVAAEVAGPLPTLLREGDSSVSVESIQRSLDLIGFTIGAIDGDFGPVTDTAVRVFQADSGLVVDGIVGPQTIAAIYTALTSAKALVVPSTVLRQGDRGEDVAVLQDLLTAAEQAPGASDGIFGTKTHQAVIAFQSSASLAVDGIVGPQTWAALAAG